MRYYKITITDPKTGNEVRPSSLGGLGISSLLPNGQTNPAALMVELDIPVAPYHQPGGMAFVKVWGLGLTDIASSANLNDMLIKIEGGMAKGLPLANPTQAGLLVQGKIFQAFGNWVGTEQSIDLLIMPAAGTNAAPINIVLDWQARQPLEVALRNALSIAFPQAKLSFAISPNLVQQNRETGLYATLVQFGTVVNGLSRRIIKTPNYAGVSIAYDGQKIIVSDGTQPAPVKEIEFADLIGQPTWRQPLVIQAKFQMRADLNLFQVIHLPKSLATVTSAQALLRFQDKSSFTGNYTITAMHHYGSSRQADAGSWNTTVDMTPEIKAN